MRLCAVNSAIPNLCIDSEDDTSWRENIDVFLELNVGLENYL